MGFIVHPFFGPDFKVFFRSRKTSQIPGQKISIALGIKIIFFALALTGKATLWMAVFADMGGSLLVVGNGLRRLKTPKSRD